MRGIRMARAVPCLLASKSLHQGKQVPKGNPVKFIAAFLCCVAMTSHASNFADFAAMNESGITSTQTAGVTRTDVAAFFLLVPTTPGLTYVITVLPAPGTPTIERYAFISNGSFDVAEASGYIPQFVLKVGNGKGELAPGMAHQLGVGNIDSTDNYSCNAAECDMTVRIELYQEGMTTPLVQRHRAN
jgi:hypothetical protein